MAHDIASSRRIFVVALGSAIGAGHILTHNARLYGYDIRLMTEESQIVNTIAHTQPEDLVIVISFWQIYENSYQTIQACEELGVPVVLLTETVTRKFELQCKECIRIPTEGVTFTTSLTAATSVIHAILSELVAVDPERSGRMVDLADKQWNRFDLLHHF
ncbi:MurR/RpiR family transcriptional regulator [Leucobacter sp. GX24907]